MRNEAAKSFRDLIVWKLSHQWVLKIYSITKTFPKDELFGLTSQLRRAAVSIPANIAEGIKRRSLLEKAKFYNIAQSSLEECRYYLILVHDLEFFDNTLLMNELENMSRLLEKYYVSVRQNTNKLKI